MRARSTWTESARARLAAMWRAGRPDAEIARELEVTQRAVAVQRHKEGLVCRNLERTGVSQYSDDALIRELQSRGYTVNRSKQREVNPLHAGGFMLF